MNKNAAKYHMARSNWLPGDENTGHKPQLRTNSVSLITIWERCLPACRQQIWKRVSHIRRWIYDDFSLADSVQPAHRPVLSRDWEFNESMQHLIYPFRINEVFYGNKKKRKFSNWWIATVNGLLTPNVIKSISSSLVDPAIKPIFFQPSVAVILLLGTIRSITG